MALSGPDFWVRLTGQKDLIRILPPPNCRTGQKLIRTSNNGTNKMTKPSRDTLSTRHPQNFRHRHHDHLILRIVFGILLVVTYSLWFVQGRVVGRDSTGDREVFINDIDRRTLAQVYNHMEEMPLEGQYSIEATIDRTVMDQ